MKTRLPLAIASLVLLGSPDFARAQESRPGPQRQEPNRGGDIDLASADPDVALSRLKIADGYEVNLFASEREFPDLGKAVAAKFDARGRLWVATTPTYPHQVPGEKPNDKLLILEDTNHDGRADKVTVFADGLYLPMGFELGDGGVYINQQPNLMFLRDTNGDDKADERRLILHGFGTEDSHHAIHAFTWSPGGTLHFQEGTFLHSQVETPYGPVRVNYAAVWEYEPRNEKLSVFVSYPFANPWGHVIDRWGQDFISDASNGNNHFGTAFSGHVDYPAKQKGMKEWTTGVKMRPTCDVILVSSRQFPDDAQGNFLVTNVIGFQGIKQYRVSDEGSGFSGSEIEPLIQSTDPNFRPVDMEFGPDGALYVVDWFNPLIGHMQYSVRDPRRDKTHGRIWRITAKGRPLLDAPKIANQSIDAQLELLKAYEDATRYRARRALREHSTAAVAAALDKWVRGLDETDKNYEHNLAEALWVYQHHDIVQQDLLARQLQAQDYHARAAAVRVLQHWLDRVPDGMTKLRQAVNDPEPRVRLEAVRALSFVPTKEAADIALEVLKRPTDYYIEYALDSAMTTLEKAWKPALMTDTSIDARDPKALGYLLGRVKPSDLAALPPSRAAYQALLARPDVDRAGRLAALEGLARLNGAGTASTAGAGASSGSTPTRIVRELLAALDRIDGTPGSSDVTRQLGEMLIASDVAALAADDAAGTLQRLASAGKNRNARESALAALLRAKGVDAAWQLTAASPRMRADLLSSVAMLAGSDTSHARSASDTKSSANALLASLYPKIDAMLSSASASPATSASTAAPASSASATQAPVTGRYVRVLLPGRETLALAEVQIMSGGQNVALKGKASQSSTISGRLGNGPAQYAIDGKTDISGESAALSVTSQERDPWWEIDLGAAMPIESITIWSPMRMVGGTDEDYRTDEERTAADGQNWRKEPRPGALHVTVLDDARKPAFAGDGFTLSPPSLTIPVSGDFSAEVQRSALIALSHVPEHDAEIFSRIVPFIRPAQTRTAAIDALRRRPQASWPAAQVTPLADTLVQVARDTPPAGRTNPAFTQTVAFAKQIAAQLPAADQQRITGALDALAVKTIRIEAVASQMKFDISSFSVEPGQEVEIIFVNRDEMPHNLLFATPGKLEAVGLAAEAMVSQPDAFSKSFIPPSKDVLWSTPLINPRETARLRFTAPGDPGSYPFICTFPGHWRTMNGVMQVSRTRQSSEGL